MDRCLIIGGGRWGRIVAQKFSQLHFQVNVVTEFPKNELDISRKKMMQMDPPPAIIYIASKSSEHLVDYEKIKAIKTTVWVEKSFIQLSDSLVVDFLKAGNIMFNQQLYNKGLDEIAIGIKNKILINSEVEKPIQTQIEMLDWLSHELSLIARMIWLQEPQSLNIHLSETSLQKNKASFVFFVNDIEVTLLIEGTNLRFRQICLDDDLNFYSNWDGVVKSGIGSSDEAKMNMFDLNGSDLLLDSIKVALSTSKQHLNRLSEILLLLQNFIFPRIHTINRK